MGKTIHGGDILSAQERINGRILDFSANLNPLGLPPGIVNALQNNVDSFTTYPDPFCRRLRCALAKKKQVPYEYIMCGNGAAELIYLLVNAIKPQKAMVVVPTFTEYQQALESVGCTVAHHHVWETSNFKVSETILSTITPQLDMLFICNPNNPTGEIVEQTLLRKILARCFSCGVTLVVDECFNNFLDEPEENSIIDLTDTFPNLFVLRAFTKIYAMAGLRLGYSVCSNKDLLEKMNECRAPWSVSTPAQVAGLAALGEKDYLKSTASLIQEERAYLKEELRDLGFKVMGSHANFIFFRLFDGMGEIKGKLEKGGILIRSCGDFAGLDEGYYRIAVRTHNENEMLIDALRVISINEGAKDGN